VVFGLRAHARLTKIAYFMPQINCLLKITILLPKIPYHHTFILHLFAVFLFRYFHLFVYNSHHIFPVDYKTTAIPLIALRS